MKSLSEWEVKNADKGSLEEQGRAIARGISQENAQKEKNQAKAAKRKETMLEKAAEKFISN